MGNKESTQEKPAALNPTELQTYIMVTQVKLTQGRNKKIALIKKKQDEIIKHLNENNLDIAKAKMESLMREEDAITVYDILGPLCEILKEKVTYMMTSKTCPEDLRASLDTLIYSSSRLEIEELHKIRDFLRAKYTNIYIDKANSNADKLVNVNVVDKLLVKPYPEAEIIFRLKGICERENIQFSFPQVINPLIVDPNINNNPIPNMNIPNIPNNFNPNNYNYPNIQPMQPMYPQNMGNMGNMPGYNYPMMNPQMQAQMMGQMGQMGGIPQQNMNQNFNNPYEQNNLNFNNIPNNFSNQNMVTPNNNFNYPQANNINANNPVIPPMNNMNYPSNDQKGEIGMMKGGFPPMQNPSGDNNFPGVKTNPGFAPMHNPEPNNFSFPNINSAEFSNLDDLNFPSSKKK